MLYYFPLGMLRWASIKALQISIRWQLQMNALLMKSVKPSWILCYNRLTVMKQGSIEGGRAGQKGAGPTELTRCLKFTNHNQPAKRTLKRKQSKRCPPFTPTLFPAVCWHRVAHPARTAKQKLYLREIYENVQWSWMMLPAKHSHSVEREWVRADWELTGYDFLASLDFPHEQQ